MAIQVFEGVSFSTSDHAANRAAVDAELLAGSGVTVLCVRNNYASPTAKQVFIYMWTVDNRHFSFMDRHLSPGQSPGTNLASLNIRVNAFEIRWKIVGSGSPMSATTGKINAAPDSYFPAFGIRWDRDDIYSPIFPD